ncbi:MAG: HAMP domain-containing histidine kinase [Polyangiaceae bacterium]|nr:HAMP domain-containing histidine kinase [Polyangiaceae bacterium]
MNPAASKLIQRVLGWQLVFSIFTTLLLAFGGPALLLLGRAVNSPASRGIAAFGLLGSVLALTTSWLSLRRHRFLLRALALGSRSVEASELSSLSGEPWRATLRWTVPNLLAYSALITPLRPALLDQTTGVSLYLLCSVIVAASSLPLMVLIRAATARAIQLAPPEAMAEVVEEAFQVAPNQRPVPRRLITAVAMPVLFVALGSALIAGSHLRRSDELDREETARAMARAALEAGPGFVPDAGVHDAVTEARRSGFAPRLLGNESGYRVDHFDNGIVQLTVPLDEGSAAIQFSGSTVPVVSIAAILITLLVVGAAAFAGGLLGRELLRDLQLATGSLRTLSTESLLRGAAPQLGPVRFAPVGALTDSVEQLTERFREFARAQERAIDAREAAARMRGLFFASVSHDLKSPLNAILGFTELVRLEPLTEGQQESLELIDRRGRELLALIETILDAARVEARQLSLVVDEVELGELLEAAVAKAHDLGGDSPARIELDVDDPQAHLSVDLVRAARALATLIGHALRTADRDSNVFVVARREARRVHLDISVPRTDTSATQLEGLLDPSQTVGSRQHRGLALGLSLVRSVIQLHGGTVRALAALPTGSRIETLPRFRVSMPVTDAPVSDLPSEPRLISALPKG